MLAGAAPLAWWVTRALAGLAWWAPSIALALLAWAAHRTRSRLTDVPMVIRRYSDGLLTTLLKARRPERYKDRVAADLSASLKIGPDPDASFAAIAALLDGLAARKSRGEPTPELDLLPKD